MPYIRQTKHRYKPLAASLWICNNITMEIDPLAATAAARYSRGSVILHWAIAVLIVLNFAAAWVSEYMSKPEALQIMGNHKAIGLTILALAVLRIVWRMTHPAPPPAETLKQWEVLLSKVTHGVLYVLLIGIPVGGWLTHSAWSGGAPVRFFGLFDLPGLPLAQNKVLGETFGELHGNFATVLLVLLGLHVAGALKHRFIDKDSNALARMSLRKG